MRTELEQLISPSKADQLLHVRNGTIGRAVRDGNIPVYKKPGSKRTRVKICDVQAWIEKEWGTNEC